GTLFPQNINLGASFNRDLVMRAAQITAYETRACGIPWNFAPVLDLGREPRWSRMWETFGEDSYINSQMGVAAVKGVQGDDPNRIGEYSAAACLKHFMGYGVPVSGRDRTPSSISEMDMRERHFAPFLEAVRAGALSVMVNSGINNGVPLHINGEYLTQWLKEDLNWDGLIVTDWADINNLFTRDHITTNKKDAIMLAINAGIDMSMVPYEVSFCRMLKELVDEKKVSMERIDDAVRRVLRLKIRLGLFENPYGHAGGEYDKFGGAEHAHVALQTAEESQVLLKNEGDILPLAKGCRILVTGANANSMRTLNGGWSYSWQGHVADKYTEEFNTIYEALRDKFGAANVRYEAGVSYSTSPKSRWWEEDKPNIEAAVKAAAGVDVIVACVGENSYCETVGNINNLRLSENQLNLVRALHKTGKPIVLVLNAGRPRMLEDIVEKSSAIVNIMLPANYGGDALANLLSGDANFSAKLPYTYPRHSGALATYDYKPCQKVGTMTGDYNYNAVMAIEWEFGAGLSYTKFKYSDFKVDKSDFTYNDTLEFSVTVTNIGNRSGKEPILLFSSDVAASVTPDNKRLRAFDKVELAAGESKCIKLNIKASDLAFVGGDGKWRVEEGEFVMRCASENLKINCMQSYVWQSPNIETY
ncbi:MAG: glycoside hydrolase family 3 N-terminal domain-containing protein, partial [Rikenellaceae bacterium]